VNRRFWIWCLLAIATAGAIEGAAEKLRIVPIARDDQMYVSFELSDAYTDAVREAIASGLRTTFTYDVALKMVVPVWVDRTIATAAVSMTDQYDNLTRRHSLSRSIDGRVEQSIVTDDDSVVRRWLTRWDRLPLCPTSNLDPSRDYYVRVSARARPHEASLLGWTSAVTGQTKFTFVP
jgi:hypothetical protein